MRSEYCEELERGQIIQTSRSRLSGVEKLVDERENDLRLYNTFVKLKQSRNLRMGVR